ncbi:MAG: TraR/DksA C4-type zinc finger protein [Chthonomonadales bacterium]
MAKNKFEKYRKRLLELKAQLEDEHRRLRNHDGDTMADASGDIGDFDTNHPGDYGTELYEREKDVALAQNVDGILAQVNDALVKLDAGTYGVCDRCGAPIPEARLDVVPYAALCVTCQARIEAS